MRSGDARTHTERETTHTHTHKHTQDVVRRMLVRDPRKRATASEVLAHEWMRENGAAAGERELQPEILSRMRNFAGLNRLKKEALRVRWGMG